MSANTHIYNKFKWWSVDDCSCIYCLHYPGKNKPCPLEICCCIEEREEALRRERTASDAATRKEAESCRV